MSSGFVNRAHTHRRVATGTRPDGPCLLRLAQRALARPAPDRLNDRRGAAIGVGVSRRRAAWN